MRAARVREELGLVERHYGAIQYDDDLTWLLIPEFPLPAGWNASSTSVLVLLPAGYPTTPPDNFYTDIELRLVGGGSPGATSEASPRSGEMRLQFSWHPIDGQQWKPHEDVARGHNLLDFLEGAAARLAEAS